MGRLHKPLDHQADGTPIYHYHNGVPACGAKKSNGEPCNVTVGLTSNGRCTLPRHGGVHAKPRSELVAIRTREALHQAMMGADRDQDRIRELVEALHKAAIAGNDAAAKYIIDHVFGSAKQTIDYIIGDTEALQKIIRVTARHMEPKAFEGWLADIEKELGSASVS